MSRSRRRVAIWVTLLSPFVVVGGCILHRWFNFHYDYIYRKEFGSNVVTIKTEARELIVIHEPKTRRFGLADVLMEVRDPPFRIPLGVIPKFATIEDGNLVCIYDTTDLGIMLIADKRFDDYFLTHPTGGPQIGARNSPFNVWLKHFRYLKSRHPELPYADRFEEWAKSPTATPERDRGR